MGTSNHPPETPLGNNASLPRPQKGYRIWAAIAALLVLLVAVAGVVLYFAKRGLPAKGVAKAAAGAQTEVAASIATLSPDEKQQAYKVEVQALQDRLARLHSYLDGFPKALTNVDALAQTLATPQAAFEYVRDHVAFEPYPGVMKGARATLLTHGGNSLDRALLLAAILKQNGVAVKISHGKLTPDQAQKLIQQIAAQPDSVEQTLRSLPAHAPPTNLTDHQKQIGKRLVARGQDAGKALNDALEKTLPLLQSGLPGVPNGAATASRQLEILQDHYWVTAMVENQPTDLDPSAKDATVNARLTDAVETFDPDDLADPLFQHMRFRLVGEFLEKGQLQSTELLAKEMKTTDLFGKDIRLEVAPSTFQKDETRFQAMVMVGDNQTPGQPFGLSGQVSGGEGSTTEGTGGPDTGTAAAAGGMLGGLGGDEGATPTPPPQPKAPPKATAGGPVLARLYWEVTSAGPHLADAHYQRVILDRLAASGPNPQIQPGLTDDAVRRLLIQVWDGAIAVGSSTPLYGLSTQLATMEAQESMDEKARARAYLGQSFRVEDLPGPALPPELINYFFSSDVARFLLAKRHGLKAKSYYERPRLALFRHGFVVGDWSRPQGALRFADGIDLLNSPFQFVGDSKDAQRLAMESGIVDTALERLTVHPDRSFSTLPLFAAASAQGVSIRTLTAGQKSGLDDVDVPAPIRNVLAGELVQGQTIILPARLVKLGNTQTFGWWSLDPDTGLALGKMEMGGAQAMEENIQLRKATGKLSYILGKFYGGLLTCYMTAEAESLGGAEEGSEELAECVVADSCDLVAELTAMAATTAVFAWASEGEVEEEIKMADDLIAEWVTEESVDYPTGKLLGAVCEAVAAGGEGGGEGGGGE
jgi:hypothetical protein